MDDLLRKNLAQFTEFTDEDFMEIHRYFELRQFRKGNFMIREHEHVPYIYFIESGLVKLFYWDHAAKEHIASFAMENWWETDFNAFYHQTKATCNLQCLEATTAYRLTLQNYHQLCAQFPYMTSYFLDKSIKGHIANQRRILSLLTLDPKQKYEQFLQVYPSLVQRIPKTILAAYLGLSRETLSRLYRTRKANM